MSCDPEIFRNGNALVVLMEQPGPMPTKVLDEIKEHLTEASGGRVRFDWHPIGGRPMFLYLGEHSVAKETYLKERAYLQAASIKYQREWLAESRWSTFSVSSALGTEAGPEIHGPGAKSIGQIWHNRD